MRSVPLLAVGVLLAGGCGKSAGGDPGDRRWHELRSDPVFAILPAGSTSPSLAQSRGGHDRPSVVATFGRSGPPRAVFRFYARHAAAAGWRSTAPGSRWGKTYPDGASATLSLAARPVTQAGSEHVYSLAGAIALPSG